MIDTLLMLSDGFFKWEDGFRTMTIGCRTPGALWLADSASGRLPASSKGTRIASPLTQKPGICGFLTESGDEMTVLSCLPDEKTFLPFAQKAFPEKRVLVHSEAKTEAPPEAPPAAVSEEPEVPEEPVVPEAPEENKEALPESFWDCNAETLTRLLSENPPEEAMNELIPGSRWVRVSENGVSFLAGVIYEDDKTPLYLCYGFERPWSETPPEDLEGYSQWIPQDFADPHGKGFWVIYTDAATGARIR